MNTKTEYEIKFFDKLIEFKRNRPTSMSGDQYINALITLFFEDSKEIAHHMYDLPQVQ